MGKLVKCKGCKIIFSKTGQNQLFHNRECHKRYFVNSDKGKESIKRNREKLKSVFKKFYKYRTTRICLSCEGKFKSEGKFNRVCLDCKSESRFKYDMETYEKQSRR